MSCFSGIGSVLFHIKSTTFMANKNLLLAVLAGVLTMSTVPPAVAGVCTGAFGNAIK